MIKNPPTKAGDAGDKGSIWVGKILWVGNSIPLQYSSGKSPGGAWWATVYGVTELDMTERLSKCIYKSACIPQVNLLNTL